MGNKIPAGPLSPVFPIVGASAQMHDREYENACFFGGIEHAIREPVYEAAMNILLYDGPSMRMSNNILYCRKDLEEEIVTEPASRAS